MSIKTVVLYAAKALSNARAFLARAFSQVDQRMSQAQEVLDTYGPVILEFTYTTAIKIERWIPTGGLGSSKAAMLDEFLRNLLIPQLEALLVKKLSVEVTTKVQAYAMDKLVEFVKDRNAEGNWKEYIDTLTNVERDLGVLAPFVVAALDKVGASVGGVAGAGVEVK